MSDLLRTNVKWVRKALAASAKEESRTAKVLEQARAHQDMNDRLAEARRQVRDDLRNAKEHKHQFDAFVAKLSGASVDITAQRAECIRSCLRESAQNLKVTQVSVDDIFDVAWLKLSGSSADCLADRNDAYSILFQPSTLPRILLNNFHNVLSQFPALFAIAGPESLGDSLSAIKSFRAACARSAGRGSTSSVSPLRILLARELLYKK